MGGAERGQTLASEGAPCCQAIANLAPQAGVLAARCGAGWLLVHCRRVHCAHHLPCCVRRRSKTFTTC
jgi:hypothetical protein